MPNSVNKKYRSLTYLNKFCGVDSSDFKNREHKINDTSSKLYRFAERILYNPLVEYKAEKERVKKDINRPTEADVDNAQIALVWTVLEGFMKLGMSAAFCVIVYLSCLVSKFSILLLAHQTPFLESKSLDSSPLCPLAICLLAVEVGNLIPVALRYAGIFEN